LHKKLNYAKKNGRQSFDKRKAETISFQILLTIFICDQFYKNDSCFKW